MPSADPAVTDFEYADGSYFTPSAKCFVLRVPAAIRSTEKLFDEFASAGCFPDYFGGNWNALLDCLRDLSWIEEREVVLLHQDLPLQDCVPDCRIYLAILRTAMLDWSIERVATDLVTPTGWQYVDHRLRVVFPREARDAVSRVVSGP